MTLAVAIGCTSSILRIRAGYDTAIIFIDILNFLRIDVILNLSKRFRYRSHSYINSTNI